MAQTEDTPWLIDEGIRNARRFFSALATVFPESTLFIAEGGQLPSEVARFYKTHVAPASARPMGVSRLRWMLANPCSCSPAFFRGLATLARSKRPTQLLLHMSVYQGQTQILDWHDAFANAILLDGTLSEASVAALAKRFGVRYARARFAQKKRR